MVPGVFAWQGLLDGQVNTTTLSFVTGQTMKVSVQLWHVLSRMFHLQGMRERSKAALAGQSTSESSVCLYLKFEEQLAQAWVLHGVPSSDLQQEEISEALKALNIAHDILPQPQCNELQTNEHLRHHVTYL